MKKLGFICALMFIFLASNRPVFAEYNLFQLISSLGYNIAENDDYEDNNYAEINFHGRMIINNFGIGADFGWTGVKGGSDSQINIDVFSMWLNGYQVLTATDNYYLLWGLGAGYSIATAELGRYKSSELGFQLFGEIGWQFNPFALFAGVKVKYLEHREFEDTNYYGNSLQQGRGNKVNTSMSGLGIYFGAGLSISFWKKI